MPLLGGVERREQLDLAELGRSRPPSCEIDALVRKLYREPPLSFSHSLIASGITSANFSKVRL
jgi:hypothetical protein